YGDPDAGTRRRLDAREVLCFGVSCGDPEEVYIGRDEWVGDGGVCSGDSGGPALDEFNRVIGVASRGDDPCELVNYVGVVHLADWMRSIGEYAADAGGYDE